MVFQEMHFVRANYTNLQKGIHETTEYLELFLRNICFLNEHNELHNRNMHISGLLKDTKVTLNFKNPVDIGTQKWTLKHQKWTLKQDWLKTLNFSTKQLCISVYYMKIRDCPVFGRGEVMELRLG